MIFLQLFWEFFKTGLFVSPRRSRSCPWRASCGGYVLRRRASYLPSDSSGTARRRHCPAWCRPWGTSPGFRESPAEAGGIMSSFQYCPLTHKRSFQKPNILRGGIFVISQIVANIIRGTIKIISTAHDILTSVLKRCIKMLLDRMYGVHCLAVTFQNPCAQMHKIVNFALF